MIPLPKAADRWLPGLIRDRWSRRGDSDAPATVWLLVADHYEPRWGNADLETAVARVARWEAAWPGIAERHPDHRGRPAQYTFFFPEEEYHPALLEPLGQLARAGVGDVEVHIHHDGEGEADFMDRMGRFIECLRNDHGLLHELGGRTAFGFIHGNWALDNARPDGRWCGLDNEITLLRELGCYADFTLPAAPDPCQTRRVNAIYWAIDDPNRPRSHDDGPLAEVGGSAPGDGLLMVQGPLGLRWPRKRWFRPALEVGELAGHNPVTPDRVEAWLRLAPRLGNHIFLKLHGHGAPEKNAGPLLGGDLDGALAMLGSACARRGWRLAHATAWEMYRAIRDVLAERDPLRPDTMPRSAGRGSR